MRRTALLTALLALVVSAAPAAARVAVGADSDEVVPPRSGKVRPVAANAPGRPGTLVVVPGRSRVSGPGPLHRFAVEVEGGLPVDPSAFAARVVDVLSDRRSWGAGGVAAFQRVASEPVDFRVTLASPALTDRLCSPLRTNGIFSCAQGGRAVLNSTRWLRGASAYARLGRYRTYMVNHEVGHLFGHAHASCPAAGTAAPVMMQQTKGVAPCRANPWPLSWERG
ncbi:MAG TPA: DUF3152 domain-containing protein [Gaiellaceae bacterium]|nr:DUF3152 domain-containing protein [Gaiellaceae bacterium]